MNLCCIFFLNNNEQFSRFFFNSVAMNTAVRGAIMPKDTLNISFNFLSAIHNFIRVFVVLLFFFYIRSISRDSRGEEREETWQNSRVQGVDFLSFRLVHSVWWFFFLDTHTHSLSVVLFRICLSFNLCFVVTRH